MVLPEINNLLAKLFFKQKERIRIYRKLSAMTRHGVSVAESLTYLEERYAKIYSPLTPVLTEVSARINSGNKLHEALQGFIPAEESMLIQSGVNSGKLCEALELSVKLIKAKLKIISSMWKALSYPCLLICALITLLLVLSRYVMPRLTEISDPARWQGSAQTLYQVTKFIDSTAGTLFLAGVVVSFLVSLATLKIWTGKIRVRFDNVPPWSFYRLITGSLWLFTLSTMMESGIQLSLAMNDMLTTPNSSPWLKERMHSIKAQLNLGKGLGQALDDSGYQFPARTIIEDLRVYSKLPGFDSQLKLIAEEWLDEGMETIKVQAKVINMACIIGIIFMISNIVLAMTSLQQQLGQNIL
ncbi:Type II secretory pathway, component PulF [Maridesulfovibrio ferrireducens]|uniref:Type II secretory pathway, component PulF n=1 Tax=Maridesulfovibrio ferrireducens TaxID=246191 RepID=A0A1G9ENV0_9BACT|nr:type II secretion system F family protein [Maridesulfovibrio ferrireducens]SDK77758.1 Type II secretory pathway, component PulF [Maridesulfovibrio ferrireducens]